jgi:hypothetical protein
MGLKLKRSDKVSLAAMATGAGAGGGLYWLVPGAHWGVYVAFGVFVFVLTLRRIN